MGEGGGTNRLDCARAGFGGSWPVFDAEVLCRRPFLGGLLGASGGLLTCCAAEEAVPYHFNSHCRKTS